MKEYEKKALAARSDVERYTAERKRKDRAPTTIEEGIANLHESANQWDEGFRSADYLSQLSKLLSPEFVAPGAGPLSGVPLLRSIVRNTFDERCLFHFFRDILVKKAVDDLRALDTGDGISRKDRARLLAELDAKIRDAEIREERAIEAIEEAGGEFLRRPDASPEIVLDYQA